MFWLSKKATSKADYIISVGEIYCQITFSIGVHVHVSYVYNFTCANMRNKCTILNWHMNTGGH